MIPQTAVRDYMKMPLASLLQQLELTPDALYSATAGQSDERLSIRPQPKRWSAKEVICHLRDIEELFILRFRTILAMDNPKLLTLGDVPDEPAEWGLQEGDGPPLDADRWAEERQYSRNDCRLALASFKKRRDATLALLKRLTPEQLQRGSVHTTAGRLTILNWVAAMTYHDHNHLDQLNRALNGR
jgi:hypothetical protein